MFPPVPVIVCSDGFSVSVQAGPYYYCSPQSYDSFGPWTHVECGYPSWSVPEWSGYGNDEEGIYSRVPVELVDLVIMKHGGIKEIDDMKRLFMLRKKRRGAAITDDNGDPLYFSNKMEAKKVRDTMGGGTVVSLGPDHWRNNDE